jgi:hypothetical protein
MGMEREQTAKQTASGQAQRSMPLATLASHIWQEALCISECPPQEPSFPGRSPLCLWDTGLTQQQVSFTCDSGQFTKLKLYITLK